MPETAIPPSTWRSRAISSSSGSRSRRATRRQRRSRVGAEEEAMAKQIDQSWDRAVVLSLAESDVR
jgi:hypothetical protein